MSTNLFANPWLSTNLRFGKFNGSKVINTAITPLDHNVADYSLTEGTFVSPLGCGCLAPNVDNQCLPRCSPTTMPFELAPAELVKSSFTSLLPGSIPPLTATAKLLVAQRSPALNFTCTKCTNPSAFCSF